MYICTTAIRILAKWYLFISLITPLKLKETLNEVRTTVKNTNPDYDLVIKRLHLYNDLKLVTFGIDNDRYLMVQFPVFIQPYTQQPLTSYQIETILVPITYQNTQAQSYTYPQVDRPYTKFRNIHYNKTT